ncbi:MAG: hypothetical protein ACE5GD_01585 [Candidatus Geothermarchaeales archaeon]
MAEERNGKGWLHIILPRVLRAALWGFIMGGELLIPLALMPEFGGQLDRFIPTGRIGFSSIAIIFVAFEVVIQLLRGTILQYALSTARTIISMILLIIFTNGGVMTLTVPPDILPPQAGAVLITVDFRTILGALLTFSLLSIMKNLLQAVNFLSQRAEEPITLPELP